MIASKVTLCLILAAFLTIPVVSSRSEEPTWLFTVPKAESLGKDNFNLGFIYADLGITEDLDIGIHGLKYSLPGSKFAFGISLFPMGSPYMVTSLDLGAGNIHLGLKAAPYVIFAGFEAPISDKLKVVAELTNGVSAGVRIFPARNWTLDIFMAFITIETYKYKYGRIEIEHFYPIPGIFFAYSGKL